MKKWSVASVLLAIGMLAQVSGQQGAAQQPAPSGDFVAGEVLVQFDRSVGVGQRTAMVNARRATRVRRFARLDIEHLRLPAGTSVQDAIAQFRSMPGVVAVQPNYKRRIIQSAPPNDPYWLDGSLWGLDKIQAQQAWTTFTTGDGSVIVASIDTGVDYTHPDLAANMWRNPYEIAGNHIDDDGNGYVDDVYGIDTVNHDSNPYDDQGHGTHTSGTIAAVGNNNEGVVGVNWNAKILACKFLDASGSGTDAGAIECFDYVNFIRARGENLRVTSNSWGSARGSEQVSPLLKSAIDAAGSLGIVNVFGAGNDGTDNDAIPFDPASYDSSSIVSVASSGPTDRRSFFSNYGATSVDLAAPGEDILSTVPGGDYDYMSGTSMATPHVAGVAALLMKLDPTLTAEAVRALLMANVDQSSRWTNRVASGGRLNAYRAAAAVNAVPNDPPSVSITGPVDGVSYKAPVNITIDAIASDGDGTIQNVSFYANGAPIGVDTTAPYQASWNGVQPGSYTVTAVATDDRFGTTTSAPIHIIVLANTPPTATITAPAEGATFPSPATVTVEATGSDPDGYVTQIAFYANGVLIGTDSSSPYSVTWTPALGSYALSAVATDNEGGTGASAPVNATIDPIPNRLNVAAATRFSTAVASSTLTPNYPASGTINGDRKGLLWGQGGGWNDATQNAGPDWLEVRFAGLKLIEEVNVFSMQDNYTQPVDPTPTMTFAYWGVRGFEVQYWDGSSWVAVPNGVVANNNLVWRKVVFAPITTTKIRVFITAALNGYSRLMEVEAWGISAGGNAPPDVALTSPAEGLSVNLPVTVALNATASDSDGAVTQVQFFVNGASIGTDTTSPFSASWTPGSADTYTLTAVATDNEGATTTSTAVHVTIKPPNVAPSVSITAPANGAAFTAPVTVDITASASDSDGTVASVQFFANGSALATDTTSPFSFAWSSMPGGTYTLTAVATDNQGLTATSAPVQIVVNQPVGRANFARSSEGGVATVSSVYTPNYGPAGAINGDRRGLNWGANGGWNDGTPNQSPDWIEIAFNGPKAIDEINVFSMQDNYTTPAEPTLAMTFGYWGLRAFDVQYWNGSAWVTVPGGSITLNNKVWRQVLFAPITTTKIRIFITGALNGYSRVIEVEAWGVPGGS